MQVKYLSNSQVDNFLACSIKWYYKYGLYLKSPTNIFMLTGSSVHSGIERYLKHRFFKKEILPIQDINGFIINEFDMQFDNCSGEKADKITARDSALDIFDNWYQNCFQNPKYPYQKPEEDGIEQKFTFTVKKLPKADSEVETIEFTGFIDYIQAPSAEFPNGLVRDSKTSIKKTGLKSQNYVDKTIQGDCYCLSRYLKTGIVPDFGIDSCTPFNGASFVGSRRRKTALSRYLRLVQKIVDDIENDRYKPCHPEDWRCSPKTCEFWGICDYAEQE